MDKVEHMVSQAKGAVKDTADLASMQLLLRRESLFDLKDRVALVTGKPRTLVFPGTPGHGY